MSACIVLSRRLARSGKPANMGECSWVYLGKNMQEREVLFNLLGEQNISLGDRLHKIAERLRQPFLDLIAQLGAMQSDQVGWWSSSCCWKSTTTSDLFLLICYEHLVGQLLKEGESSPGRLVVVIEDAWLFRQLQDAYRQSADVEFHGTCALWPVRVEALPAGLAARALWMIRLLRSHFIQTWYTSRQPASTSSAPCVALYSYPQERCFSGAEGWSDPCLGDLDSLLEKAGHAVCRFSHPQAVGFEEALARRHRYFIPLILYATPLCLLRSALVSWRPVWPVAPELEGKPIRWLLLREWWRDRWRASYMLNRVFLKCMRRWLELDRPKLVIYPYENQPWERMLILAAREYGIPTLGYQHGAGIARFVLSYFHGSGEAARVLFPDLTVTSGRYSRDVLAEGGTPCKRLIVGGSLRYQYLRSHSGHVPFPTAGTRVRILVALSFEATLTQHLLHSLRNAFPDGGAAEGLEFAVKPHPECPVTQKSLRWAAAIVSGTFEEAVRACAMVIYTGSSAGLEALAMGRTVIRYRSELLLNIDPGEFLTEEDVVDCSDSDLRTKVLSTIQGRLGQRPMPRSADDLLARVYVSVDEKAWLDAVDRLCRVPVSV